MEFFFVMATAFGVGIMTSISPCPLATNITAITFISRKISNRKVVFLTGSLYALGRILAYVVLASLVFNGIVMVTELSAFLQTRMLQIIGPLLILIGMVMLELVTFRLPIRGERIQKYFQNRGVLGAFPLGVIFALSFCPVSAALFFGSLIPMALQSSSFVILPFIYGLGTGVPVLVFSILIAYGARWVGILFDKIKFFDLWFRRISGSVFIVAGIYLSLIYIFKLPF